MPGTTRTVRTALAAVTAGIAVAASLAACSSESAAAAPLRNWTPSASKDADTSAWSKYTFTVGDNGGDGSQALAAATGVFKTAKYKVNFARFTFGPPLIQAAASGAIDIGSVGDVPPITGAAKTYGFKIVAVERSQRPDQAGENIIVPKGSKITSVKQLRGKKIAVPQGSSAHGLVLLALRQAGLTPKDVTLDFLDPAAGASAFSAGKVDAWAIWTPQVSLAISHGARVIAKGLPPIDQTSSYYVASTKSLGDKSRRAALRDVLYRLAEEFRWANAHRTDYAKAIATETGITLADAKTAIASRQLKVTPVLASDVTAEQQLADAFLQAGQITKKVDVKGIVDNLLPAGFDSAAGKGSAG